MKLSYEDKLKIVQLMQNGVSWPDINQKYSVQLSNFKYLIRLMNRHDIEAARKGKNKY